MKNYCILRQEKIKSVAQLGYAFAHNYRTNEKAAPHADISLRSNNEELCDGAITEGKTFNEIYEERVANSKFYKEHNVRKNSVPAVEMVLSFSADMTNQIDIEAWKQANIDWLKKKYGKNLISAMYHDDEYRGDGERTAPHIHAVVLPFDEIEQLNASKICGNRMDYFLLQDEYAHEMKKFGLERGQLGSDDKHVSPKKYNKELREKITALTNNLPEIRSEDSLDDYRDRVEEYLVKVASKEYQDSKDDKQKISKLRSEVRELKLKIIDSKNLDDVLSEKGYGKKKNKLDDYIKELVNEDDSFRPYEKLFQYLGLDHENVTIDDIKKARDIAARGSQLQQALDNYHDREIAIQVANELSMMFKEESQRKKEKEKVIAQRAYVGETLE